MSILLEATKVGGMELSNSFMVATATSSLSLHLRRPTIEQTVGEARWKTEPGLSASVAERYETRWGPISR